MRRAKSDYAIQTVTNALRLLEAFEDADELGVTELARRLALHKNNVFRLLATLEQKGYVARSATGERYRLGPSCLGLGRSFARGQDLLRRARPALEDLARETGETAHLAVLQDLEVVHLDGVASPRPVLSGTRIGRRLPAHCTALGKVLLGCAPRALQETFAGEAASGRRLPAFTPATITDPDKLLEELASVAARGWASDLEEWETGLSCVAAPVHGESGWPVAAISLSGPVFRLTPDVLEREMVPRLLHACASVSRDLGAPLGASGSTSGPVG